jgi:FlaA1/EpsC-like NDP-sugar epimerase
MNSRELVGPVLGLPRVAKRVIALLTDMGLCVFSLWLAYYLRLGEFVALTGNALLAVAASILIALPVFVVSGLYRAIFRYGGWPAMIAVTRAVALYGLLFAAIFTAVGVNDVPRTVGLIQPILLLLFVGASRVTVRVWLGDRYRHILKYRARPKVLIYGAGSAGRHLASALGASMEMQVAGFLDDDPLLRGQVLNGLRIYSPGELGPLVPALGISTVLLAMPRISRKRRNEILGRIRGAHVSVRTLPSLTDIAQGRVKVSDLRELEIDDLLGRDPVQPDADLLRRNVAGKVVLVTGAGGSIGGELCRQILDIGPARLLLVEHSEFALYAISQELERKLLSQGGQARVLLTPLLASVQDRERMQQIMSAWQPETVYHAAAYKHVPLVEHNPVEGIRNNVLGTLNTALAAQASGVRDFVLISTDKAVRPTNVMGASKRLAEMMLQALAAQGSATLYTMVRFGNVLGSSGSVVPKFRQQLREGGPITLTHPDITRYFMTIPEAAQLVIQAGAMAKGGDVFVLDMGEPVRIIDLAQRMVELSGLTLRDEMDPDGDVEIQITGLRPGEKLYEELLIGDNPEPTSHPRIMRARENFLAWDRLDLQWQQLQQALASHDMAQIRRSLQALVAGYVPSDEIVDWIHLEQAAEIGLP